MGSLTSNIQKILVLYVTIWTIAPPLQLDNIYRIAALGAVILWFILDLTQNVNFGSIHVASIIFLLMIVLVTLMENDLGDVLRPIAYYMLIICFIIAHSYSGRWTELTWIVPIVLILLTYFNTVTYDAVVKDPAISRLIVRNDPEIYDDMRRGVGGYSLLYTQVCVFPMIVTWIINAFKYSKIRFAVGVAWMISYWLYLLNSGFTIAVVTTLASLIILFFYKYKNVVPAVVIIGILVVLLVRLIGYNDDFRLALLEYFDGTTVAKKINDIHLSITTEDTADSIMSRIIRYRASLEKIFEYPVFGSLWFESGGGHSAILDTFCKYGFFGGYVFLRIIFDLPIRIKETMTETRYIKMSNAVFISIFMIGLLDSFTYNFICLIVFIIPTCYNDILVWRKKDENTLDSKLNTAGSGEET